MRMARHVQARLLELQTAMILAACARGAQGMAGGRAAQALLSVLQLAICWEPFFLLFDVHIVQRGCQSFKQ